MNERERIFGDFIYTKFSGGFRYAKTYQTNIVEWYVLNCEYSWYCILQNMGARKADNVL